MTAADIYAQMVLFSKLTDTLYMLAGQLRADTNAALEYLSAMPPMATDVKISFGDFEDYSKVPAPLDAMFAHMKTGGAWIVRVGQVLFYANSIDALNKTAVLVRVDSTGNKVTNLKNAAVAITGILPIAKRGA
jgi:hypothetical protein